MLENLDGWAGLNMCQRPKSVIALSSRKSFGVLVASLVAKLIVAIAISRLWVDELVSGTMPNTDAIATRENLHGHLIAVLHCSLAFLAPDIFEGRRPGAIATRVWHHPPDKSAWRLARAAPGPGVAQSAAD